MALGLYNSFQRSFDEKSRINFPAELREGLGPRFIITKGLEKCLCAYSETEWRALEEKIRALPGSKSRGLQRFFFAGAADIIPDKQGRIVIPASLREYAGLDRDVMIVGVSNRAEIWDKAKWEEINAELTPEEMLAIADELGI